MTNQKLDREAINAIKARAENEVPSSFEEDGRLIQALRADVLDVLSALEAAESNLGKYGWHQEGCVAGVSGVVAGTATPCRCGFLEVLATKGE